MIRDLPAHAQLIAVYPWTAGYLDIAPRKLAIETIERLLHSGEDRGGPHEPAAERLGLHLVHGVIGEVAPQAGPVVDRQRLLEIPGIRHELPLDIHARTVLRAQRYDECSREFGRVSPRRPLGRPRS